MQLDFEELTVPSLSIFACYDASGFKVWNEQRYPSQHYVTQPRAPPLPSERRLLPYCKVGSLLLEQSLPHRQLLDSYADQA